MPHKNVQLPDGRIVAFPDSMADADISAIIKKQLAPQAPGVAPTKDTLADMFSATHNLAPMGTEKEAAGNLPMLAATAASSAAGPEAGVLVRILLGMFGAGAASPIKQKLQGKEITGGETAFDTATGAVPGAIEGLASLKGALGKMVYTGKVAADGTPELSKLARGVLHPTELPENVVRAVVPPPEEAVAAAKAQAGEANAAKLEAQMNEVQAARQKELAQWERLRNQEAQALMNRGKQQAALDAAAAKNVPKPGEPLPFPGATSTASPVGTAKLPAATSEPLQGQPTPFVSKFSAPETSRIVTPLSPAPPVTRTLVSYDRDLLVHMARGGDLQALRELIRNPGSINVSEAVPNARYLLEQ